MQQLILTISEEIKNNIFASHKAIISMDNPKFRIEYQINQEGKENQTIFANDKSEIFLDMSPCRYIPSIGERIVVNAYVKQSIGKNPKHGILIVATKINS